MITVERTDFVSVPVTDMARAKRFYGETLGLPLVSGDDAWPEYQLGENVSLYLIDPTNMGGEFTAMVPPGFTWVRTNGTFCVQPPFSPPGSSPDSTKRFTM